MSNKALQHRRLHNLLLIEKLFAVRGEASPFTLLLDSVEQSAKPLIERYIHNAKISKINVIYVSYETLKPPPDINTFIKARRKDPTALQKEILSSIPPGKRILLILDTLHPLCTSPSPLNLPTYLSTLLHQNPPATTTTLLAIYHLDIPLPIPIPSAPSPYTPSPLTQLKYLATTLLTTHSFPQTLTRKRAQERSLAEPVFGLAEEREGAVVGRGANGRVGVVVEMEYRRKSGRGVEEWFFVPPGVGGKVGLLEDCEGFRQVGEREGEEKVAGEVGEGGVEGLSTFDLGITEKQRRDREEVVLPYFDAQVGGGEGGRILYDMGVEDDFDEEEDEI